MSRKSVSSSTLGALSEVKIGGDGYYSGLIKSETGSSDYGGMVYDDGSDSKNSGVVKGDSDAMTVHRRKMMRRAANRRSAQLSRARKKVSNQSRSVKVVVVTMNRGFRVVIHCLLVHRRCFWRLFVFIPFSLCLTFHLI